VDKSGRMAAGYVAHEENMSTVHLENLRREGEVNIKMNFT
jgi:hypothetical protein